LKPTFQIILVKLDNNKNIYILNTFMKFVLRIKEEIPRDRLKELGFDGMIEKDGNTLVIYDKDKLKLEITDKPENVEDKALVLSKPYYRAKAKFVILRYMPLSIREIHQYKSPVLIDGINDISLYPKVESMKPWGIITEDKNFVDMIRKIINKPK